MSSSRRAPATAADRPAATQPTTGPSTARTAEPTTHGATDQPLAASARGLTKTYGRGEAQVHALRGVDLDVPRGRFTAIMGPSGSGKSTLMHCLAGLDRPSGGTVAVGGTDLGSLGDDALTVFRREHIGFVFQSFNLLPMLTARQNILLPLELAHPRTDDAARERAHELADSLGVADRLDHRPAELSGGQQQRVAIARALITRPSLLFADEPTGNLDSTTSAEVLDHLRRSARELGQTVVMVTHEPDAAAYADDVVTVQDGLIA
ncbi:ABC transporter ATP-binding protein [Promicromonospora sp. MEB111]|uniref:ABC transporter ATP-binding protein n=1 Tax=unclassified Promicromonospora TaxID=2647929 RepID=UPI00254BDDAB|nr:ABC transporter ATP-binding protein [Promicromonospora sp. MEB111]